MPQLLRNLCPALFLLLFGGHMVFGQSWAKNDSLVATALEEQDFQTAFQLSKKGVDLALWEFGKEDHRYAISLADCCELLRLSGEYREYIPFRELLNEWMRSTYGPDHPDYGRALSELGYAWLILGDYGKSIPLYAQAVSILEDTLGRNDVDFGLALGNLGILYQLIGQNQVAIQMLQEALQNTLKNLGRSHPVYVDRLSFLADAFYNLQQYNQALPHFRDAVHLSDSLLGITHPTFYRMHNNLAITLLYTGELEEAKSHQQVAHKSARAVYGTDHPETAKSIQNLARVVQTLGDYDSARYLYHKALALLRKNPGRQTALYATALGNLALLHSETGELALALSEMDTVLQLSASFHGTNHLEYAGLLSQQAIMMQQQTNFDSALVLLKQSTIIYEKRLGLDHPLLGSQYNALGELYRQIGKFSTADSLYTIAEELLESGLGPDNSHFINTLSNHALLYHDVGRYAESVQYYRRSLNLTNGLMGKNNGTYAISLGNLGLTLKEMGQFELAVLTLDSARFICAEVYGTEHPNYARQLNNLGNYYYAIGRYDKALPLFKKTVEIGELSSPNSPDHATFISNLALLYVQVGQFERAHALFSRSVNILERAFGNSHPKLALMINNRGLVRMYMGRLEGSIEDFETATAMMASTLGKQHQDYSVMLNNLSLVNMVTGRYEEALSQIKESVWLSREKLGEEHPEYAMRLNSMSNIYYFMDELDSAIAVNELAVNHLQSTYGRDYGQYDMVMRDMGQYYHAGGSDSLALISWIESRAALQLRLRRQLDLLNEKDRAMLVENAQQQFGGYASAAFSGMNLNNPGEATAFIFDNELLLKGLLLSESRDLRGSILESGDTLSLQVYNNWTETRQKLAKLYSLPTASRGVRLDSLESRAGILEEQLAGLSAAYRETRAAFQSNWQSVRNALEPNEAAVEYMRFPFLSKTGVDSFGYGALVLRPEFAAPRMVMLCSEEKLEQYTGRADSLSDRAYIEQVYANSDRREAQSNGQKIYDLLIEPIDSLLGNASRLYYAPAGLLHRLSLAALPDKSGVPLIENLELLRMGSTRLLTENDSNAYSEDSLKGMEAVLFGGIQYESDRSETDSNAVNQEHVTNVETDQIWEDERSGGKSWHYLPGTLAEVRLIGGLLKKEGIKARVLTTAEASETNFKSMDGRSPAMIHLSTHGFFYNAPEDESGAWSNLQMQGEAVFSGSANPLMRSGLVLTGGNDSWVGGSSTVTAEDGILTAYEIAHLDLSSTQLVVLSACETGLGENRGSEGVYGLQRAFKMAGVEYVLMSLWKVPDRQTAELMGYFYKSLLNGLEIETAFRSSQQFMSRKYGPYYWGAFVLLK